MACGIAQVLLGKIEAFFSDARDYQDVIDRARIIGQEQMFLIAAGLLAGTMSADRAGRPVHHTCRSADPALRCGARRVREAPSQGTRRPRRPARPSATVASARRAARSDLDFIML